MSRFSVRPQNIRHPVSLIQTTVSNITEVLGRTNWWTSSPIFGRAQSSSAFTSFAGRPKNHLKGTDPASRHCYNAVATRVASPPQYRRPKSGPANLAIGCRGISFLASLVQYTKQHGVRRDSPGYTARSWTSRVRINTAMQQPGKALCKLNKLPTLTTRNFSENVRPAHQENGIWYVAFAFGRSNCSP